jgi:hypothetical protein
MRDGARRSSIGTAPAAFSMRAEPKPASPATTQPERIAVPHNTEVTCAIRCGFFILLPPKTQPESHCTATHATELIFRGKTESRNGAKYWGVDFLGNCRPNATEWNPMFTAFSNEGAREKTRQDKNPEASILS